MNLDAITTGLVLINTAGLGYLVWARTHEQQTKVKHQIVVDTSGLIDGRIIELAGAGFIPQRIIIPQFVVAELQYLADQADAFKRERARFGLEVVRRLQEMRPGEVVITPGLLKGIKEVDDKLVALAKKNGAMLYTTDFNLNQVAEIEGVSVLNVNQLAQGLRATFLPGEKAEIKITQVGQDRTQGVGYLDDGTMVVVEQGAKKQGHKVEVEFSRILQTQAGKMMFAVMVQHKGRSSHPPVPQPKHEQRPIAHKSQPPAAPETPRQNAPTDAPAPRQPRARTHHQRGNNRQRAVHHAIPQHRSDDRSV